MRYGVMGVALAALVAWAGSAAGQVIIAPPGGTATSLSVSTLTTGTVLSVQPTISADGRYVTMGINLSLSSLDGIDTFNSSGGLMGSSGGGGTGGGGGSSPGMFPLRLHDGPMIGWAAQPPYRPMQVGDVTFVERDASLLATALPAMKLEGVGLKQAMKQLGAAAKTNLVLGYPALRQAKIDENKPVTLDLPGQSLKASLLAILKAVAPGQAMVVSAEDQVIYVTTQAEADTRIRTQTYYAIDLIGNAPRWLPKDTDLSGGKAGPKVVEPPPPSASLAPVRKRGLFDEDPAPVKVAPVITRQERSIAELITANVRPEIWKVNGGKIGEIHEYAGRVTITAPESVHILLEGPSHRPSPNQAPMWVGYGSGGVRAE